MELYNYKAEVINVVDGDTVKFKIDLGFRIYVIYNCRFAGINADEIHDINPELKESGLRAKKYLTNLLTIGKIVEVNCKGLDKYGRPLVTVFIDNVDLNQQLINLNFAKKYM